MNQESKKIQYFIYCKPILFPQTTCKIEKILAFSINLLKITLNVII
jgi:hypothetical protein